MPRALLAVLLSAVAATAPNLFPSPVGDLGVLRETLQAIGGV
jgi:hypothetical protein